MEVPEAKKDDEIIAKPTTTGEEAEEDDDYDDYDHVLSLKPLVEDRDAVKALLDTFDETQLHRYEAYRRAHFPKASIRKIVHGFVGHAVPASVGIIVAGVSKIFVGEMTELALDVMEEWGHAGPIRPDHLREAYRRYRKTKNRIPNKLYKKRLF